MCVKLQPLSNKISTCEDSYNGQHASCTIRSQLKQIHWPCDTLQLYIKYMCSSRLIGEKDGLICIWECVYIRNQVTGSQELHVWPFDDSSAYIWDWWDLQPTWEEFENDQNSFLIDFFKSRYRHIHAWGASENV